MLSNLISISPDALAAQKDKKKTDQEARQAELDRLQGLLSFYTNTSKTENLLPEDVEYFKKFLKDRIAKIQTSPSLTEDQIIALKNDKDSFNFDNVRASSLRRAQFKNTLTAASTNLQAQIDLAKANKTPIPTVASNGLPIIKEGLDWFKKTKFETKDEYDTKLNEIATKYKEKTGLELSQYDKIADVASGETKQSREKFDSGALFRDVLKYVGGYLGIFLLLVAVVLGSSLATNLNLYRNAAFRILYAIYGGVFFFLVIPYCLGYRWAWLGLKPKFYSLIPLVPYHWNNRIMQILFGWISYRPDDEINVLKEWESITYK